METNEIFIRAWIGKKQEIMYRKMQSPISFNIWSALFMFLYFLYRKMYLIALILFIIQTIIMNVVDTSNILIQLIIRVIIGMSFYPLYKWDIQRKIRKLLNSSYNYMPEQMLEMCKKKGGTTIAAVILPIVIIAILVVILIASLGLTIFNTAAQLGESGTITQNNEMITQNQNNSSSEKQHVAKLKFTLPDGYKASTYNSESFSSYNNEEIWTNMYVYTASDTYYDTTEEFVKQYIYNLDTNSINDFETDSINGNTWIKYEIENTYNKEYYFITKYDSKFYLVEFVIIDENYENSALKHLEVIKNSLEMQ